MLVSQIEPIFASDTLQIAVLLAADIRTVHVKCHLKRVGVDDRYDCRKATKLGKGVRVQSDSDGWSVRTCRGGNATEQGYVVCVRVEGKTQRNRRARAHAWCQQRRHRSRTCIRWLQRWSGASSQGCVWVWAGGVGGDASLNDMV